MSNHGYARRAMKSNHNLKRQGIDDVTDFEPQTTAERDVEQKRKKLKEFTHDSQFQNLRKTYDEDIAYKKEKMLRGLVQKGHDPLAQLAMSKEMLRYHQELEAVRSKGMRVHEFEDLRKKKRKKKKRKRKDKRKHKHKKSSSSKKRKKKRKRKSLRSSGSGSSDHSESDSDSSNSSSEDSNDSDTKRYKKKKMRQQQKREMANAAASARAAALRARAEKAEAEADAERQAKKEEEVREKQKRELELQKQRTKYMEEQKKLCEEAFAARPAYLAEKMSGYKKGYKYLSFGDKGPGYYRDD